MQREYVPHGIAMDTKYLLPLPRRPKPESPSFYTGSQSYYDKIVALEAASTAARRKLQDAHVLPLTPDLKAKLPITATAFMKTDEMSKAVGLHSLRPTQYKKVIKLLSEINQLRSVAEVAKQWEVEESLTDVIEAYERGDKAQLLAMQTQDRSARQKFDEFGRTYAVGKRKTSAARVWIIPAKSPETPSTPEPATSDDPWSSAPPKTLHVPTSTILINNLPLADFFPTVTDREKVSRPLKLAGMLGKFNVFALVRGGGTTGQAEALAHGISKALIPHVPQTSKILQKGNQPISGPSVEIGC